MSKSTWPPATPAKPIQAGAITPNTPLQRGEPLKYPQILESGLKSTDDALVNRANFRPYIAASDEQLMAIISAGVELSDASTPSDYAKFNAARDARAEQFKRALHPASGNKLL